MVTMVFGIGAAFAAFPPIMDASVNCLGRKGAVIAGGAIFCIGSLVSKVPFTLLLGVWVPFSSNQPQKEVPLVLLFFFF